MSTEEGNTPLDTSKLITDEHVKQVLRADKGPEAQLSSWVAKSFTERGDNYASIINSVKVNFILQGKEQVASYVVKINSKIGILENVPELSQMLFQKESGFYRDLSPELDSELKAAGWSPLNVPRCYLTDLESHNELIFLEDLRSQGFQMYDHEKGLDQAHTNLILQELARLHAASLLLQAKTPHTDLAEQFNYLKLDLTNISAAGREAFSLFLKGPLEMTQFILGKYEGYKTAEKWATTAIEAAAEIYDKFNEREAPFEVLCHGDCWTNNAVFRYNFAGEPVEVKLLDLQACRIVSPAIDLANLFFTSLDGVVRETHLNDFLATYYNTFTSVLKAGGMTAPFTLSELRQEYTNKEEFGALFGVLSVSLILVKGVDTSDPGAMTKLREEIANKMKGQSTKQMENNEILKSRFFPLFGFMKD